MGYTVKFDIGDTVLLKTDREKLARIVTGFSVRQNKTVSYDLSQGGSSSWHYDFEIEAEQKSIPIGFKRK